MKERGIIFGAPMIRALLAGTKTQTRRSVKVPRSPWPWEPEIMTCDWLKNADGTPASFPPYPELVNSRSGKSITCPYGAPGDRLWVRETFAANIPGCEEQRGYTYRADHLDPRGDGPAHPIRWTPCLLMPRVASRITLEITEVRVDRLQAITEEDARAEGAKRASIRDGLTLTSKHGECLNGNHRDGLQVVWDSINAKRAPWSSNPWVWALTFKRVTT